MTFRQMGDLLAQTGIASLGDVPDRVALTNLQTRLLTGELGIQSITSDKLFSPLGPDELKLPRSFTFFGQKFVLDSWAFSQVVFDKVHWPSENCDLYCGVTNICGKVVRRKPSCLDIAFSVFGNDQVAPYIISRIQCTNGEPFRDGLPYQHNLMAVRNVIENQAAETWTDNIYTAWLAALRGLSAPTTGAGYPEAMRTRAWGMKTLNTQLGSWTELRHDTLLYAKQSYTPPVLCSYPYGYVEPRPEFWRALKTLAEVAASAISQLPVPLGSVTIPGRSLDSGGTSQSITCDLGGVKQSELTALHNFSATMTTLENIAQKELNQQPLAAEENDFLRGIMEYLGICNQGQVGYTGWYPGLFYQNVFWSNLGNVFDNNPFHSRQGCAMFDALVADVHTDLPDENVCDPGAVIHEAVGNVHLLMIAVDSGPDRMVYAGPVFSQYELEVPGVNRISDEDWKATLTSGVKPAAPEWTQSFLAQTGWGYDNIIPRPNVAGWGANDYGQLDAPGDLTNAVHIGGHGLTGLAVRENGTVAAWGRNASGETAIPEGLSNVVAVSGLVGISVALKTDGTVAAWGGGGGVGSSVTNVPTGLSDVVAVDASARCAIAVKEDGTVVAWGDGATNVPPNLSRTVAVSVSPGHVLALKDDGSVLAWVDPGGGGGYYEEGLVPAGLSNVVAIAAGASHSLALKDDGTVVGWGSDYSGQLSIFQGLSNIVAIAAGWFHSAGLKADGTVISSKGLDGSAGKVPQSLSNAVEITAGGDFTLALVGTSAPVTQVPLINPTYGAEDFTVSIATENGHVYRLEYANSPDSSQWQGLRLVAGTGQVLTLKDSVVAGQQRFYRVRRW
jgi:alpha-tubulin suppressor-like RCC1 family protein